MNVLNQKVSYFYNYRDTNPKEIKLLDFITSSKFANEVTQLRTAKSKAEKDILKSKLPAVTPSGLFHKRRASANLVLHSGLIQIDIDGKDNKELNIVKTKELLKDIEQVCFCAYSVSGTGLFALVPIAYPEKHKEHFLALEEDFKDFNIVIDTSCKDVCRLRGYTYDEYYYINKNAHVYDRLIETSPSYKSYRKTVVTEPLNDKDKFCKALGIIESNAIDITGDYNQWFSILCAIANEFGEGGRGFVHLISQYSPLYDNNRTDKVYSCALKTNYSYRLGTFYHYLKQDLIS